MLDEKTAQIWEAFGVRVHAVQQGTAEWLKLREGLITCSNFGHLFGTSKAKNAYLARLRSPGDSASFTSAPTTWGKQNEKEALSNYMLITGAPVIDVGFITRGDRVGGSPDGLIVNSDTQTVVGGVEIKCPYSPDVHFEHCDKGLPARYFWQVHGYMWLTQLKFWDFVSYDPRRDSANQIIIQRVLWDDELQKNINFALDEFLHVAHLGSWFAEPSARAALLSCNLDDFLKA